MEECGSAVPAAIVEDASHALMGATAARVGMFTKDTYDECSVVHSAKNPLRVRDVEYLRLGLVVTHSEHSLWVVSAVVISASGSGCFVSHVYGDRKFAT